MTLLKCYIFSQLFVKNSEIEAKMLSALLTGVNRAFPFAKGKTGISEKK